MFLKSLKLKGILSFRDAELKLRPLNVLIGPNGSGKSNLIKVIGLVSAFSRGEDGPARLASESVSGVGWLWAGEAAAGGRGHGRGCFRATGGAGAAPVRAKDSKQMKTWPTWPATVLLSRFMNVYMKKVASQRQLIWLAIVRAVFHSARNLYLLGNPELPNCCEGASYELASTANWAWGQVWPSKRAQPTDQPDDFLEEDGSNLLMILNRMELDGSRKEVEEHFKRFYEPFQHSSIQLHPRGAQLAIKERRLRRFTQSSSLSDGTIRYLCLLAILCHPDPPPLICIEEPEIGLHPDILRDVALLLLEASERTQLIVTTHSDILINALSGDPETVVGLRSATLDMGTSFERLSAKKLDLWLERYKLGELWRKGQLGGVPW